ncbi:arginase family protein [Bacillus horti]|uniref:Arginase n=1 Tax=Caldalkalibacillus horti TaxID=77523 RepID=A0ABT9VZT9_9BACI|nr:arginase family protein [Bacillus horti]MDQ0166509.1 arginase [Bacillus horti]
MKRDIQIIHAPTNIGLSRHPDGRERGCGKLPEALEKVGLHTTLGAQVFKRFEPPIYPKERTFNDGALNALQVAGFSRELADVVESVLDQGSFPLVLGGDCSVLVGSALALKRNGHFGLLYLDAHHDYYHKGNRDEAVVGGMNLAIVTGKGTEILTNLGNQKPYFKPEHVFSFGIRQADEDQDIFEEVRESGITLQGTDHTIKNGAESTAALLKGFIQKTAAVDGFWIHLDADILDASIMSCVDCPEPEGLQWEELKVILKEVFSTNRIIGMNVTILDPELDPKFEVVKAFSNMLTDVLS